MSDLETAVGPLLTPIVSGVPTTLSSQDANMVRIWIAKTAMMMEMTGPLSAVTDWERRDFYASCVLPLRARVWVGSVSRSPHLPLLCFWQRTTGVYPRAEATRDPLPPPNVAQVTMAMGDFVAVFWSHRVQLREFVLPLQIFGDSIASLSGREGFSWPPGPPLVLNAMHMLPLAHLATDIPWFEQ